MHGHHDRRQDDILELPVNYQSRLVTPDTAVVTFVPATRAEIKAGTPVFAIAIKKPDGTLGASRVSIGRDGVAPPM